jgi:hypothetical protein
MSALWAQSVYLDGSLRWLVGCCTYVLCSLFFLATAAAAPCVLTRRSGECVQFAKRRQEWVIAFSN